MDHSVCNRVGGSSCPHHGRSDCHCDCRGKGRIVQDQVQTFADQSGLPVSFQNFLGVGDWGGVATTVATFEDPESGATAEVRFIRFNGRMFIQVDQGSLPAALRGILDLGQPC